MKWKWPPKVSIFLLLACLLINLFSRFTPWVEKFYSLSFYKYISIFLRKLFGWIPFSLGDCLYAFAAVYIILKLIKFIRFAVGKNKKERLRAKGKLKLVKFINIAAVIYIVFNLFWGINYNRQGIASQLQLNIQDYEIADLKSINLVLAKKVNETKLQILTQNLNLKNVDSLFEKSGKAYKILGEKYSFLAYRTKSVKKSFWSLAGNYLGFTGYYNPFTGEAQVNTTVPFFSTPYTTCHEIAHQLGYAKEMEANFVGYLACKESGDPLFTYSAYLDLFRYANRNLYYYDSVAAFKAQEILNDPVKNDLAEWRRFSIKYKNPVEPYSRWLYALFLRSNQQPQGMLSYDEVTGFLIAYYKKFGEL